MTFDLKNAEAVLENIRARRTVPWTRLKSGPILPDHLDALLEAANWAPSHKHTEPWRFVLFRGEGRKKIADLLAATYKASCSPSEFKPNKYEKSQQRPLAVPLVMAILMRPSTSPVMPEFEEVLAMGCAMQNLHLAAHSLGIGCSWSTPGYVDHPNIRNYFELEPQDRCMGFYYLGYMDGEPPTSKRGLLSAKVTYINA